MTEKERIIGLRRSGKPCSEIAKIVGKSRGAVQQAVYRAKLSFSIVSSSPCAKRYDWHEVQRYYDSGHDRHACLSKFNISGNAWDYARKNGCLKLRPRAPREDVFKVRKFRATNMLKHHLSKIGWIKGKCSKCGISEWQGMQITIQIDHINGDHADNNLENLRELCPNCHSQTPTYGSRNVRTVREPGLNDRIKSLASEGKSQLDIARETNSTPYYVAHVVNGWKRFRYT